MAKPAAAPARTPIPAPDFNALNGKVVVMDVDGKENSIRVEPKTKQITHKGGFGGYASWTVHAKGPNVAQLQNRAYPDLYLRVDGGKLAAGAAQDLTFTFKDGKGSVAGAAEVFTLFDNTHAANVIKTEGPVKEAVNWAALDGSFVCLDSPGAEGTLRVEGKPPAVSTKGGKGAFATWEVDYVAPGQITLENEKFDNVYLRLVNGNFEASGTGKADATLNVMSHPDGTVSFPPNEKHFTVILNPQTKRQAKK